MRRLVAALVLAMFSTGGLPAPASGAPVSPTLPMTFTTTLAAGSRFFFTFRLFDAATGGNQVWAETTPTRLTVSPSRTINWTLGSVVPFADGLAGPVDFSRQLWVQFTGGGKTPARVKLTVVPYAMWSASAPVCVPGDFVNCYEGQSGTLGVGTCKSGLRTCSEAGSYLGATCAGQVVPVAEDCNGLDDNCNGIADDHATCLATGGICSGGTCVPCDNLPGGCLGPITITFGGLTEPGAGLTTYDESGFTVSAVSGSWEALGYGHPGPAIGYWRPAGPSVEGEVAVTAGGASFRFDSVELYSSVTQIPYVMTGYKGTDVIFTTSGTVPHTFGNYALVMNPSNLDLIDRLVIKLTNPGSDFGSNPVGIDNIAVSR